VSGTLLHRRRASTYVMVLMTSMFVMVVSLAGLTAARIDLRAGQNARDVVAAKVLAESAIDAGLFWVTAKPDWRDKATPDVWFNEHELGAGMVSMKLVDEAKGDFTDPKAPFRLFGRGTVSDAVRIYSVELAPVSTATNGLLNGNMEDGTKSWTANGCTLESHTGGAHSGSAYLYVKNRSAAGSGPSQDIPSLVQSGEGLHVSAWAKVPAGTTSLRISIQVNVLMLGVSTFSSPPVAVGTNWTLIDATITPSLLGSVLGASLVVDGDTGTGAFLLDDVSISSESSATTYEITPGSWRWEEAL